MEKIVMVQCIRQDGGECDAASCIISGKAKDFSNLSLSKFVSALHPQTKYAQKAAQK
jgi:hypothetical protein